MKLKKIGLGGGCHWCTEGVFSVIKGVSYIDQGWIASNYPYQAFSEAIILEYNPAEVSLEDLIRIHLHTHASTSNHSMRSKYRSAIYSFNQLDMIESEKILRKYANEFANPIITKTLIFKDFKSSPNKYQNYYQKNVNKPFCQTYISPKVRMIMKEFRYLTQ